MIIFDHYDHCDYLYHNDSGGAGGSGRDALSHNLRSRLRGGWRGESIFWNNLIVGLNMYQRKVNLRATRRINDAQYPHNHTNITKYSINTADKSLNKEALGSEHCR